MTTYLPKEIKLWVNTPHGRGLVLSSESFAFDNTIWTVILESDGRIRHYNSCDLNVCPDFTDGVNVNDVKSPCKPKHEDATFIIRIKREFASITVGDVILIFLAALLVASFIWLPILCK